MTMYIKEDREIKCILEEKEELTPSLEDNNEVEYPINGEILVIRQALSVQTKEDVEQWGNIFHTKYYVNDKEYSMIIDGGSCINIGTVITVCCVDSTCLFLCNWWN